MTAVKPVVRPCVYSPVYDVMSYGGGMTPPAGYVFVVDNNGDYIVDENGNYLITLE